MIIADCPWELNNLDCKVVEVKVDSTEQMDIFAIKKLELEYDYIVVKVESGNMLHSQTLNDFGYYFAETQLTVQKNKSDWDFNNDSLVKTLMLNLSVESINCKNEVDELLDLITPNMFSTDRIYLDPLFGPEYSVRRYKNWISNAWNDGTMLRKHYFRDKYVGFSLCKIEDLEMSCMLAGCFKQYQHTGIGLWIPLIPELYDDIKYKTYVTHISTNNYPVWQMYNRHHYLVTRFEYVFVKHITH